MSASDFNAELARSADRGQWTVGWFSCAVSSLLALVLIVMDWQRRTTLGKVAAVSFLLFLILVPVTVVLRLRARKEVSPGWIFGLGYLLLFLALHAFGPLAHMR